MEYVKGFKIKHKYVLSHFKVEEFDTSISHGRRYIDYSKSTVAKIVINKDTSIICNVYISEAYRGFGLSYQLLDIALNEYGADTLMVNKHNRIAIHAYERYGFRVIEDDGLMYTMKFKGKSVR